MSVTYCDRCETIEDDNPETLVVGEWRGEQICQLCLTEQFEEETTLSHKEAWVAAVKRLSPMSHAEIAEFAGDGTAKSTIDEYSRRANQKVETARRTVDLLG